MSKLVLIDGHSILNRAFYGMPDLTNSRGVHTGAVYGFLNILFRILDEEKPEYLTVAFDVHAPTFRHKAYEAYKGTRHPMPEELRTQVPLMKDVLHSMGILTVEQAGLEADDILGTLAKRAQADGLEVSLVSGDRDLLQIADEHIRIRIPKTKKGQTTVENYYAKDVKEALQVTPAEFIQVKALQGDTADNIPGVPKVGPKTATELIVKYHSVAGVYEHLDEITKKGLHDNLEAGRDLAKMSLFLATIKTDCDLDVRLEDARIADFYTAEAYELFNELGFRNYLSRFDESARQQAVSGAAQAPFRFSEVTGKAEAEAVFERAAGAKLVSIFPVYDQLPGKIPQKLLALALSFGEENVFLKVTAKEATDGVLPAGTVPEDAAENEYGKKADTGAEEAGSEDADEITAEFLCRHLGILRRKTAAEDPAFRLALFDVKNSYPFLDVREGEFDDGIRVQGILDLLLMAYLLNPLKSDYQPEDIASEYLQQTIVGRKALLGKLSFMEKLQQDGGAVADYAAHVSRALLAAAKPCAVKLQDEKMWRLYQDVELPLTYILYDMQRIGIRVVPHKLKAYGDQLVSRIGELDASIHRAADDPDFNISSPKQLGEILFDRMHLPGGKKTKTGYSTAADVLEKLAPDYPIVADILEYRALTKLKSTYADGLAAYIAEDSRIHTTFNQTITATGRISSTDPNLQNIPMRTELGRAIRKVFIPKDGYCFTDSDYSQIELRILASMSGDPALIEAYRENRDIHRTTASKVFHVPFDEVTPVQRRDAKAVNFGIVYGISSFGLSQNLSISRQQAAEYIREYFAMFPGIKTFLDRQVADAKENGYSVTYFGRRRPIPELKSSNFMQRQFGERVAMNAPIQGTGADIMKTAMIRVWEELHKRRMKSQLILQIHDELLIETAPGEEQQVEEILKTGMMGAADLKVELEVECHRGSDWFEAK